MKKIRSIQQIYHLADERNWSSIQAHGLLSATQLLERAQLRQWNHCYRKETLVLPNGLILRDQRPIPPTALTRCLTHGLEPSDWYALLNRHIFFWIDRERLNRQRQACNTPQYVMTINATKLLANYAFYAAVTPFNIGNARRAAALRCKASFVSYHIWRESGWGSEATALGIKPRPLSHKPVELTIAESIPDIFDFVIDVKRFETSS